MRRRLRRFVPARRRSGELRRKKGRREAPFSLPVSLSLTRSAFRSACASAGAPAFRLLAAAHSARRARAGAARRRACRGSCARGRARRATRACCRARTRARAGAHAALRCARLARRRVGCAQLPGRRARTHTTRFVRIRRRSLRGVCTRHCGGHATRNQRQHELSHHDLPKKLIAATPPHGRGQRGLSNEYAYSIKTSP